MHDATYPACVHRHMWRYSPVNNHTHAVTPLRWFVEMQMQFVEGMSRTTLLLCQQRHAGSAAYLPSKEVVQVLLATLDALLAALSGGWGSLPPEVATETGHVVAAAKCCAEVVEVLLTTHPELKPGTAASFLEGRRVLLCFRGLEGPGGRLRWRWCRCCLRPPLLMAGRWRPAAWTARPTRLPRCG
jgi:hypothetical protein